MLPQVAAHNATNTPDLRSIFTPRSHEGALDPSREIVVGDRGVGKSFWSSVLKDDAARAAIAPIYPRLRLTDLTVSLGFSEVIGRPEYPSDRINSTLLRSGVLPEFVWRAVVINSINPVLHHRIGKFSVGTRDANGLRVTLRRKKKFLHNSIGN